MASMMGTNVERELLVGWGEEFTLRSVVPMVRGCICPTPCEAVHVLWQGEPLYYVNNQLVDRTFYDRVIEFAKVHTEAIDGVDNRGA